MLNKMLRKAFQKKLSQKEVIFFILEVIFLFIFLYLSINTANQVMELGNYFHNVNIALFTILIPLAIAVLSDYFRTKRNNENINYSELDLIVIINRVFDVRLILITLLLSYLPSFFWFGSGFVMRNVLLVIWLVGIGILIKIILDFIIWIKDPYYHRYGFLKKIREDREYVSAWTSVWKVKENDRNSELEFFEIFSKNINILIDKREGTPLLNSLLGNFSRNIENRDKDFLIYSGKKSPLEEILEWYYKAERYGESEKWFPFDYEIYPVLEYIEIQSLDKSYGRYLRLVKIHLDKHSDDIEYIENFFISFLSILFSNSDKISSEWMFWKAYPKEWKIKAKNLESKRRIPFVSLREVIFWSEQKISDNISGNVGYDPKLSKIFYGLFSDTEPISWSGMITFLFSLISKVLKIKLMSL